MLFRSGKTFCCTHLALHLGFPNGSVEGNQDCFLAPLPGKLARSPHKLHLHQAWSPVDLPQQRHCFLAPLPGRKRISARGVSHLQSFYFVFVLLSLFYFVLFASFYQKHKKNSSYSSCYFCCSVFNSLCCSLSTF